MTQHPSPHKPKPQSVICKSATDALALVSAAHRQNVPVSYHPHGGMTPQHYYPVTHTVWLDCSPQTAHKLTAEVAREKFTLPLNA